MKTLRTRNNFLIVTFIIGIVIGLAALSGQSRNSSARQGESTKSKDEKKLPIAVYSASLPADSTARAQRLARSSRYDKRFTEPFEETSPDTTGRSSINEWYLYVPALPTSESDAVVVGKIVEANGYLSTDKTGAYSEFTILIEELFKDARKSLTTDASIIAEREGADVRLPNGRIIRYQIAYQGTPQTGGRYVLFLKYNEKGNDYQILTGYELRKGLISPLDEADHFNAFNNSDEATFLKALHKALAYPTKSTQENRWLSQ